MTDGMKQKMADMAYKEAERLRWMNVRGDVAQVQCPHCGKVITIKTED